MAVTNNHNAISIPVIDVSQITEETGHDLVEAVIQHGFVFIKSSGLGLDAARIEQAFEIVSSGLESG